MTTAIHPPEAATSPEEAEIATTVQSAARDKTPLEIVGGGSRRALGRPVQAAATLSTAALSGVSLYQPEALTLVAKAGTPLSEIEATLAAEGQMLSFEPMDHRPLLGSAEATPTIGGVVACAVSGPRRIQAGACRDSLIGVRFVNGAGEIVKSGGRVMKNVTGYDLVKLMSGAFGTLGVLTEVSFKVLPMPETAASLIFHGLEDKRAIEALSAALGSPFEVTGAAHLPTGADGAPATMIRLEGFADSVAYRAGALRDALRDYGDGAIESDASKVAADWAALRDCQPFASQPGAVWRISMRPSSSAAAVAAIKRRRDAQAFYDWGGGLVWVLTAEEDDAGAAAIRDEVAKVGGDATLLRASETTRATVDVFPPQPAPLAALTRGVREKFDPAGILNPGRMGR